MEKLLTHIDRFTTSLRPLSFLIELVIEKIIPHQQARAGCEGYHVCYARCEGTCRYGHDVWQQEVVYYSIGSDCGTIVCRDYFCNNCDF
jgi:hypothetical protein